MYIYIYIERERDREIERERERLASRLIVSLLGLKGAIHSVRVHGDGYDKSDVNLVTSLRRIFFIRFNFNLQVFRLL